MSFTDVDTFPSMLIMLRPSLLVLVGLLLSDVSAATKNATVLILGGGVAGVIAARTLHEQGITDFKIIEARHELGGRLQSFKFGVSGNEHVLELGANWVQGTETPGGPKNPIWNLVQKHGLKTQENDWTGSISTYGTKAISVQTCDRLRF